MRHYLFSALEYSVVFFAAFGTYSLTAGQIPEEYESMGGHGLSLNDAAVAGTDGVAAVRVNPALLSKQRLYNISGGYHWPAQGREFYQAGIVDGKTSKTAAGVTLTSFSDQYVYYRSSQRKEINDAPIARRGALALSQTFDQWALGIGVTYVEGFPFWSDLIAFPNKQENPPLIKGFGANLGLSWALNQNLDFGAAIENASNRKIAVYLPRTSRLGLAYRWAKELQFLVDYRNREKIPEFESTVSLDLDDGQSSLESGAEQSIIGGFEAQIYDVVRLTASHGFTNELKAFSAAGIAIVNKNMTIAYGIRRPDTQQASSHQAFSVSFDLSI